MYTSWERRLLVGTLLLADALSLTVALALAYYLRLESGLLYYGVDYNPAAYAVAVSVAVPIWLVLFAWNRLYDPHYLLGGPQEYARVVGTCTYGMVALVVVAFFVRRQALSRGWLVLAWPLAILFVGGTRFLLRRAFLALRWRGAFITRTLIIGTSEHARAIAEQYSPATHSGVEVVGFLDDFLPPGTEVLRDLEVLGAPSDLVRVARQQGAKQVIIVPNAVAWESFQELMSSVSQANSDLEIQVSPGFYEILSTGARMTHRGYVPLLVVDRVRIIGLDALLKHTLDYGFLLVTLPLWLPLVGVFALVARLLSAGPVLKRPQVLGCQGQVFTTGVFHVGYGETQPSSLRGRANAAFRRFLYESGLNKLPQFFNVLLGQMSLVGPRPVNVDHTKALEPWLPNLLTVRPGVTGPWVMAGKASLAEEMRANVYYIRNYTIWLDLQLLFKSFTRMVRRRRHRPATFGEEVDVLTDRERQPALEGQLSAEGRVEQMMKARE